MSRVRLDGRVQSNQCLFTSIIEYGVLAQRHCRAVGGTWAAALLGPDLKMPGCTPVTNHPAVFGFAWDKVIPGVQPAVAFNGDLNVKWIRGHLVNAEWGGSGGDWENLTPLTSTGNSNHKTVEDRINAFLGMSYSQDHDSVWVGVLYSATCSKEPWAEVDGASDLYAYAPAFIKVSYRAVSIEKPTDVAPAEIPQWLAKQWRETRGDAKKARTFDGKSFIKFIQDPIDVLAGKKVVGESVLPKANNKAGGDTYSCGWELPPPLPNGFDQDIEIHQN